MRRRREEEAQEEAQAQAPVEVFFENPLGLVMSSYDSGARQLWRHAHQDRSLAQSAYEALGGVGALPRYLPDVWDAFGDLAGGGGLLDLPDDVTALEPTGLADNAGDLTTWTPTRNGGTTASVVPAVSTPQVTRGASGASWAFFEAEATLSFDRLSLTQFTAADADSPSDADLWIQEAGGVMLVASFDLTSVSLDQTLWATGSVWGAETGVFWQDPDTLFMYRDGSGFASTANELFAAPDVACILHVAFGDAGGGLGGWQPNALIDAPPPAAQAGVGGYVDGFRLGNCVGDVHGAYVYTGGPAKAAEAWRYVMNRWLPVLGGG